MNVKINKVVMSIFVLNFCIMSRLIVLMDYGFKDLKLVIFICEEVDYWRRVNLKEIIYFKIIVKIIINDIVVFILKNLVK